MKAADLQEDRVVRVPENESKHVESEMLLLRNVGVELDSKAKEHRKGSTLNWKIVKTIFLVLVWASLGLCGEITGPTLLDLKLRTRSNYEAVSTGVSGRGAGFFVGSALGGVLVDRFGGYCDLLLALGIDSNALTTASLPWLPSTDLIFLMTFLQGVAEGVVNLSGQKLILNMWLEKSASPLHLLHEGYGIGAVLIPLVANPFLAKTETLGENITMAENVTLMVGVTTTIRASTTTEVVVKESRIEYAYVIAALITILVSMVFFGYHLSGGKRRRQQKKEQAVDSAGNSNTNVLSFRQMINPATCAGGRFFYGVQLFLFVFLFFVQTVGGERVVGKFIRAYSVKHMGFSENDGSYINSVFWIAFAVGRIAGFLAARFLTIRLLTMIETGGCLLTAILLTIFGENTTALWILIAAMGFFIGPMFPSGVGWANYHIDMTGIALTFFMFGSSLGGMAYMRLTGYLLDRYGYRAILFMLLGFGIAVFAVTVIMNLIGAKHGSRFSVENKEEEEEEEEEDDDKRKNENVPI